MILIKSGVLLFDLTLTTGAELIRYHREALVVGGRFYIPLTNDWRATADILRNRESEEAQDLGSNDHQGFSVISNSIDEHGVLRAQCVILDDKEDRALGAREFVIGDARSLDYIRHPKRGSVVRAMYYNHDMDDLPILDYYRHLSARTAQIPRLINGCVVSVETLVEWLSLINRNELDAAKEITFDKVGPLFKPVRKQLHVADIPTIGQSPYTN